MTLGQDPIGSLMACRGCGTVVPDTEAYPFRCPAAGDGGDHVLHRVLDLDAVRSPPLGEHDGGSPEEAQPFVRFRSLIRARHLATAGGLGDDAYVEIVRQLDRRVAEVDGHGFVATPFRAEERLGEAVGFDGPIRVKDETGNVAGSHKARHLFGLLVHLEVVERLGLEAAAGDRREESARDRPLAIASCGNAALAAAVVASAGGRRLVVFVPSDADPGVVHRLEALGAEVTVCERIAGEPGDPTYHRLRAALAEGALPFTCQGNENGLAIEGAETLGYEIVADLVASGAELDHVVVQVGGGALASALADSLVEAHALGALATVPVFHTVQTEGAWPLKRAHDLVSGRLAGQQGPDPIGRALREAGRHRAEVMWPWEATPHSIAHGILDDETYDWMAVTEAMLRTGGEAVVVGEEALGNANALAVEATGIAVDPTGSAGLAGLVQLRRRGVIGPGDRTAVLFTGVQR